MPSTHGTRSIPANLLLEVSITDMLNDLAADAITPFKCASVDYLLLAETFEVRRCGEVLWYANLALSLQPHTARPTPVQTPRTVKNM